MTTNNILDNKKQNINPIYSPTLNDQDEFIISLEGLFLTDENTYIIIRSTTGDIGSINIYINQIWIRRLNQNYQFSYINFKAENLLVRKNKYLIITMIKTDLSHYDLLVSDLNPIFPSDNSYSKLIFQNKFKLPSISNFKSENESAITEEIREKVKNNQPDVICDFQVKLDGGNAQKYNMKQKLLSDKKLKFKLGKILYWEKNYIMVTTPFNYLDIIDYHLKKKVASIDLYSNIVIYNISQRINDPVYGYSFIIGDDKGKIQYIRPTKLKDKLNIKFVEHKQYFNDLGEEEKLSHFLFSTTFYYRYLLFSFVGPFISGICGHLSDKSSMNDKTLYRVSLGFYITYAFFGLWFKLCVYNINDESHTERTCTTFIMFVCYLMKNCANVMFSYKYCQRNETAVYFISALFAIIFINLILNCIIYRCKVQYLLRTYLFGYLFYHLSRICIILFFLIVIFCEANYIEIYIYAGILSLIFVYIYFANYFNILMKELTYKSYLQALFNFPMEWVNILCTCRCCKKPKDCFRAIDYQCCCCDECFLNIAICIMAIIVLLIYLLWLLIYYLFLFCQCIFTGHFDDRENEDDEPTKNKEENKNKEETKNEDENNNIQSKIEEIDEDYIKNSESNELFQ